MAFEAGLAELGRMTEYGLVSWSIEAANRRASSDYNVNHPSAGNCTDLSATKGNYSVNVYSPKTQKISSTNIGTIWTPIKTNAKNTWTQVNTGCKNTWTQVKTNAKNTWKKAGP